MQHQDRRLAPPREVHRLRLVRAGDTKHNLRVRAQVAALLALAVSSRRDRP